MQKGHIYASNSLSRLTILVDLVKKMEYEDRIFSYRSIRVVGIKTTYVNDKQCPPETVANQCYWKHFSFTVGGIDKIRME